MFTWISLALFTAFLYFGPFMPVDLKFTLQLSLLFNTGLSLIFFFQHSFMIRRSFHRWLEKFISPSFHRSLFAVFSGGLLSLVVIFWQPTHHNLMEISGVLRWICRAIFLLAIVGFFWAGKILQGLDTSGAKTLMNYLNGNLDGENQTSSEFTITGPYRWVRHPLYFFTFLMIWSFPDISADRILFSVLWTCWIIIGAFMEEKDLVQTFGDSYLNYQQRVPMLIPNPFKRRANLFY